MRGQAGRKEEGLACLEQALEELRHDARAHHRVSPALGAQQLGECEFSLRRAATRGQRDAMSVILCTTLTNR